MLDEKSDGWNEPPRPAAMPSARPSISASSTPGSLPLARKWPWPRWVLSSTSVSASAAQLPAATASCPMHGCMPLAISPALTSSSERSSNRRISRMVRYRSRALIRGPASSARTSAGQSASSGPCTLIRASAIRSMPKAMHEVLARSPPAAISNVSPKWSLWKLAEATACTRPSATATFNSNFSSCARWAAWNSLRPGPKNGSSATSIPTCSDIADSHSAHPFQPVRPPLHAVVLGRHRDQLHHPERAKPPGLAGQLLAEAVGLDPELRRLVQRLAGQRGIDRVAGCRQQHQVADPLLGMPGATLLDQRRERGPVPAVAGIAVHRAQQLREGLDVAGPFDGASRDHRRDHQSLTGFVSGQCGDPLPQRGNHILERAGVQEHPRSLGRDRPAGQRRGRLGQVEGVV